MRAQGLGERGEVRFYTSQSSDGEDAAVWTHELVEPVPALHAACLDDLAERREVEGVDR